MFENLTQGQPVKFNLKYVGARKALDCILDAVTNSIAVRFRSAFGHLPTQTIPPAWRDREYPGNEIIEWLHNRVTETARFNYCMEWARVGSTTAKLHGVAVTALENRDDSFYATLTPPLRQLLRVLCEACYPGNGYFANVRLSYEMGAGDQRPAQTAIPVAFYFARITSLRLLNRRYFYTVPGGLDLTVTRSRGVGRWLIPFTPPPPVITLPFIKVLKESSRKEGHQQVHRRTLHLGPAKPRRKQGRYVRDPVAAN